MQTFTQDPNARLDYAMRWGPWLNGDVILTSEWFVSAPSVTAEDNGITSGITTGVWLSGGQVTVTYTVTNRITTLGGRINEQSFRLYVANQ